MDDEITRARKKKRRRYNAKRTLRFIFALLAVLIALVLVSSFSKTTVRDVGDWFKTAFSLSGGYPAALGSSAVLQTQEMSLSCAFLTDGELIVLSRNGERLLSDEHGFVAPFIVARSNRVMLCNRGSRDVRVYNRTGLLSELKTDNRIIDAAVSDTGDFIALTESDRYMCELALYKNGSYENTMTWKGAEGFPALCAISSGGSCAVAATVSLGSDGVYTIFTVIDLASEKEKYSVRSLGLTVRAFVDDDGSLLSVTDTEAVRFSSSGEISNIYDYGGKPLIFVARDKGTRTALAFGDNKSSTVNSVTVLSASAKPEGDIIGCGLIKDIYVSNDRIYILGDGTMTVYASSGEQIKVYTSDTKALKITEFSSIIEVLPKYAIQLTDVQPTEMPKEPATDTPAADGGEAQPESEPQQTDSQQTEENGSTEE